MDDREGSDRRLLNLNETCPCTEEGDGIHSIEIHPLSLLDESKLEIGEVIYNGENAVVREGRYGAQRVAIKNVKCIRSFWSEIQILTNVRHEGILKLIAVAADPPRMVIVTELVDGGNLRDYLQWLYQQGRRDSSFEVRMNFAIAICEAMANLHMAGFVHGDLNPNNILLRGDKKKLVVSDFGLGTGRYIEKAAAVSCKKRTYGYTAPECFKDPPGTLKHLEKRDVYSFAMVLWELLTCENPFSGMGAEQQIGQAQIPSLEIENLQPDLANLLENCWMENPRTRYHFFTINRVLNKILRQWRLTEKQHTTPTQNLQGGLSMRPLLPSFNRGSVSGTPQMEMIWRGALTVDRLQGGPIILVTTLQGYMRRGSASGNPAANWPPAMHITGFIGQEGINHIGRLDLLAFLAGYWNDCLAFMRGQGRCALIELPSHTLQLSVPENGCGLIGELIPKGREVVRAENEPLQEQLQQQQRQQLESFLEQMQQSQQLPLLLPIPLPQPQPQQMVGPGINLPGDGAEDQPQLQQMVGPGINLPGDGAEDQPQQQQMVGQGINLPGDGAEDQPQPQQMVGPGINLPGDGAED